MIGKDQTKIHRFKRRLKSHYLTFMLISQFLFQFLLTFNAWPFWLVVGQAIYNFNNIIIIIIIVLYDISVIQSRCKNVW